MLLDASVFIEKPFVTALLSAGFDSVDYFEISDGETLKPVDGFRPGLRIFAAAWLRETRLIDNLAVDEAD